MTGFFAPTSRFGTPDDFKLFVDACHAAGIGVILDWVPGHFPKDSHGLAQFDGTALYEHEDPRQGEHQDWGTLIFNYGRNEVRNFLLSSALFWLEEFHLDGLRVDAVASMLYLDYSRAEGQWVPNRYGGRENLDAVSFVRQLNEVVHAEHPGVMMIAEESTAWPAVSRPVYLGGLGFTYKWNMGWMHDILKYTSKDPIHRRWEHNHLTFSMLYAYNENFILPFSHDEVVHGKRSMIDKMPGDSWQKAANLRALYAFMFTHPGKKLLFMGSEFAQWREWNHDEGLPWTIVDEPPHDGVRRLVRDLNTFYRHEPALYQVDFEPGGFEWIDCTDNENSVVSFLRRSRDGASDVIVILNFTPIVRETYSIGVPAPGRYREVINTDASIYGGGNVGNGGAIETRPEPSHGHAQTLDLRLPPLGALILTRDADARQGDDEGGALIDAGAGGCERAAVQFDQFARDRQAEAEPAIGTVRHAVIGTAEALEHVRQEIGTDAAAGVADFDLRVPLRRVRVHVDLSALRRELDGIRQQIPEHLTQTSRIAAHRDVRIECDGRRNRHALWPRPSARSRRPRRTGWARVRPLATSTATGRA